jgi:hypothetical protein
MKIGTKIYPGYAFGQLAVGSWQWAVGSWQVFYDNFFAVREYDGKGAHLAPNALLPVATCRLQLT